MSLLDMIFGRKQSTASVAKNRLTVMLATERGANAFPFMEDLRRDIMEVIQKYAKVKDVTIKTEQNDDMQMLEVEIVLDK